MFKIYYSSIETALPNSIFSEYLELFAPNIQNKILKFSRWQDAHAFLYGKLLLKKGLEDLGLNTSLKEIKYSSYGKPYLECNVEFSISHSSSYVVCALSTTCKIGIDL